LVAPKKNGLQTVWFQNQPVILGAATIVGPKEGQGPLARTFDKVVDDNYYGEKSWERAERRMLLEVMKMAAERAGVVPQNIDFLLAGDLLNQIISANFAARDLGIPFLGLYGACSTMYESMAIGSMLIDGGFADYVLVASSSHFATAERQYRYPTEQGTQRPLHNTWTVTGAAAMVLGRQGQGPRITHATIGKVIDMGQGDPMDMPAAMAPAAADTIARHLIDTGRQPDYYDLFVTGDLGIYGRELALKLLRQKGYDIEGRYTDCGAIIYSPEQDVHAGGSGCACAGVVTCGYLLQELKAGRLKRIFGAATGALLSPISTQQGETIPAVAHGVVIEA
jgi:stage V sporulation protein AD